MGAGRADTTATLPETGALGEALGASPAVALTVLFHPRVDRVGERAILGPRDAPWEVAVSRAHPDFAPVQGGAAQPLGDEHLSRKPVLLAMRPDGAVDLDASGTPTKVVIRKSQVERRCLSPGDVQRGVVLLLGGHVVLLLHVVVPASQPVSGEPHGLLGQSDGLRAVLNDVRAVADLPKPVLLRGPSGSGKELVARAIHREGRRNKGPFVAVNLGAVPATIAAAELFGAEKGGFTGAVRRAGYFEQARGGTLFLDEIGEAAVEIQAALLRAIQDGEIQPLGADRARKVDVRVVAATDANLEARVKEGSFRAPLLSRLAAYQIWIPSLAERRDDIGRLLARLLEDELAGVEAGRSLRSAVESGWIPAPLIAELCEHDWPGNIRQLRNVVGHLVIPSLDRPRMTLSPSALRLLSPDAADAAGPAPAPASAPASPDAAPPRRARAAEQRSAPVPRAAVPAGEDEMEMLRSEMMAAERRRIVEALEQHAGNQTRAAKALGVSLRTLVQRIEKYGLPRPRKKD